MPDFDPDAYLAEKRVATVAAPSGFDPDAYLKQKGIAPPAAPKQEAAKDQPFGKPMDFIDPRTGLRHHLDPNQIPGAANLTKGTILQGGGATVGAIAGSPLGPLGVAGGALLGGIIGNVLHQETSPGYDVSKPGLGIKKGEALASGLVSAIPGGASAEGGILTLGKEALKQGGGGVLAKNIETGIDEGRLATGKENALAATIPALGGALAQKAQSLAPEAQAALNAVKPVEQQSYEAGKKLGLVTTNGAGKPPAVMANLASTKNQPKINEAAAVDLGLPKDTEITASVLDGVRKQASAPYADVEAIAKDAAQKSADIRKTRFTATNPHDLAIQMNDPKTVAELAPLDIQAAADINGLRKARDAAKDGFSAYKRSGDPKALEAAQNALESSRKLEDQIEQAAQSAGKPELVKQLAEARQRIAKTYDYEQALNSSTGDISAPVLGAMLNRTPPRPLSGNAKAIADFHNAFPFAMKEGASVMSPGVTRAEGMTTLLSTLSGAGAGAATGHPGVGALAGLLPLTGPLKRQIVLSGPYQSAFPRYPESTVAAFGGRGVDSVPISPEALALLKLSQAGGQRASEN